MLAPRHLIYVFNGCKPTSLCLSNITLQLHVPILIRLCPYVYLCARSQVALDIEYLRRSVCFESHYTTRSGDDTSVTIDGEFTFAVGDVMEYCIEAVGALQVYLRTCLLSCMLFLCQKRVDPTAKRRTPGQLPEI